MEAHAPQKVHISVLHGAFMRTEICPSIIGAGPMLFLWRTGARVPQNCNFLWRMEHPCAIEIGNSMAHRLPCVTEFIFLAHEFLVRHRISSTYKGFSE